MEMHGRGPRGGFDGNGGERGDGMGPGGIIAQKVTFKSAGRQPLLWAGPGSIITIDECVIDVPAGTPFIKYRDGGKASNVVLTLGKNCTRDAQGFAVNTPDETFITYATNADSDNDGFVIASGRVAVFGKKGTRWQFDAKTSEGYRYKLVK